MKRKCGGARCPRRDSRWTRRGTRRPDRTSTHVCCAAGPEHCARRFLRAFKNAITPHASPDFVPSVHEAVRKHPTPSSGHASCGRRGSGQLCLHKSVCGTRNCLASEPRLPCRLRQRACQPEPTRDDAPRRCTRKAAGSDPKCAGRCRRAWTKTQRGPRRQRRWDTSPMRWPEPHRRHC